MMDIDGYCFPFCAGCTGNLPGTLDDLPKKVVDSMTNILEIIN
jgi:hypothetical protein